MTDPAGERLRAALIESADRIGDRVTVSGEPLDQILARSGRVRVRRTRARAALAGVIAAAIPVALIALRPGAADELRFTDEVASDVAVPAAESATAGAVPRVWGRGDAAGTLRAGSDTYVQDVVALGAGLVAVGSTSTEANGADGLTWHSADGLTWERTGSGEGFVTPGVVTRLRAVAAGPQGVVGVGERDGRGTAWSSHDGRSWREATVEQGAVLHDIVRAGGTWVAVGEVVEPSVRSAAVWSSPDGVAWVSRTVESTSSDASLDQVATDDDRVVALGDGVAVSADGGVTWAAFDRVTAGFGPGVTTVGGLVALPRGGFLAVAGGPSLPVTAYRSPDGRSWSATGELASDAGQNRVSELLVDPSGVLVAVGSSGDGRSGAAAVWTSRDEGSTWTTTSSEAFRPGTRLLGLAATETGLVAVGQDEGDGASWRSLDGR